MGNSQSYPGLTEDVLEDYTMLTYLSQGEILYLMKKFYSIDPEKVSADYHHRFSKEEILKKFDVLRVKENCRDGSVKQDQPRSNSKNVLQDKLVNIDSNSNSSSSGLSLIDKTALFKSNSMPSFEEAAKMRARRQISFDNIDFPKR